jgi:hypothetical protein
MAAMEIWLHRVSIQIVITMVESVVEEVRSEVRFLWRVTSGPSHLP